jgi:hypothetical protein
MPPQLGQANILPSAERRRTMSRASQVVHWIVNGLTIRLALVDCQLPLRRVRGPNKPQGIL